MTGTTLLRDNGRMHDLEDGPRPRPRPRRRVTIDELRRRRGDVYLIAERYGVSNVRVFGSVARGEADDRSDLDLLIDVAPGRGLFTLTGFALDVEDLLGVFTQVVTVPGLKARIRDRVLTEAVPV